MEQESERGKCKPEDKEHQDASLFKFECKPMAKRLLCVALCWGGPLLLFLFPVFAAIGYAFDNVASLISLLMAGGGALGILFGFLFAIPKIREREDAPIQRNNALSRVSEWVVALLVGAGIAQTAYYWFFAEKCGFGCE